MVVGEVLHDNPGIFGLSYVYDKRVQMLGVKMLYNLTS